LLRRRSAGWKLKMRLAFFLLLLLNLLLYPFVSGLVGGQSDGSEPLRMSSQLKPDSIRILQADGGPVPDAAAVAPPEAADGVAAPAGDAPAADAADICQALTGLAREQVDALGARIRDRQIAVRMAESELVETTSWWVHIPDLQTRQLAERKQAELRALGVRDMIVMSEPADPQNLAISLGLFKTEAAAKELLASLNGQGVRSARISPREGPAGRFRVELRGAAPVIGALLADLPAGAGSAERAGCP
jgi:hypothetical protein